MGTSTSNTSLTFDDFPVDLTFYILSFGSVSELCQNAVINHLCHQYIFTNDPLWRRQCLLLWKDKVFVPEHCLQLANLSPLDIQSLNLRGRIKDIDHLTDDTKNQSDTKLITADPDVINECDCRKAYRLSLEDRNRIVITIKELLNIKFYFHFKGSHDNDWKKNPEAMTRMQFHSNGVVDITPNKFTQISFMGQKFLWKFDGSKYGEHYGNAIAINNYPKEWITRSDDWGWIAQNPYVIYASFPIPDPESKEYQDLLINYFVHEATAMDSSFEHQLNLMIASMVAPAVGEERDVEETVDID